MFRAYVPVQGFDEGSFCRTVRALPWLVVAVVPVHVVHKTSEAPALLAGEDRDDNYDNDYVNNDAVDRHVHMQCMWSTRPRNPQHCLLNGMEMMMVLIIIRMDACCRR